jgi:hypothetical protein
MAQKLLATAREHRRPFNDHHLVADVLNGMKKNSIRLSDDNNHNDGASDDNVAA